jgi:hypothetical protein
LIRALFEGLHAVSLPAPSIFRQSVATLDAEATGFAAIATQQKVPNANPRSLESSLKQLIPTIERASE